MPFLALIFILIPFVLGVLIEIITCSGTKTYHKGWKILPFMIWFFLVLLVLGLRIHSWTSESSIVTTLLLVPGLPGLFSLWGLWFGYRIWRWWQRPRIVKPKKPKEPKK